MLTWLYWALSLYLLTLLLISPGSPYKAWSDKLTRTSSYCHCHSFGTSQSLSNWNPIPRPSEAKLSVSERLLSYHQCLYSWDDNFSQSSRVFETRWKQTQSQTLSISDQVHLNNYCIMESGCVHFPAGHQANTTPMIRTQNTDCTGVDGCVLPMPTHEYHPMLAQFLWRACAESWTHQPWGGITRNM